MTSTAKPLTNCPVCRYDLTGLPKTHACPECGFEYDESMRIWSSGRKKVWIIILFSCPYFVFWLWTFLKITALGMPAPMLMKSFAIIVTFSCLPLIISILVVVLQKYTWIISDAGLYFSSFSKKLHFYSWTTLWLPSPSLKKFTLPSYFTTDVYPKSLWQRIISGSRRDLWTRTNRMNFAYRIGRLEKPGVNRYIALPTGLLRRKDRAKPYAEIYQLWKCACDSCAQDDPNESTS